MNSEYRLAGRPDRREHLARRLDRIAIDRVGAALEPLASDFGRDDGPVYRIRRLDLSLWLNADQLDDGAIARDWADALGRALSRKIVEGGSAEVVRYPSHAAYLASWIGHVIDGIADDRWEYVQFRALRGMRPGAAITQVLASYPQWILPTVDELSSGGRRDVVVDAMNHTDIRRLWVALVGDVPRAPATIPRGLIEHVARSGVRVQALHSDATDDERARRTLRLLLDLASARRGLVPAAASGLAMQLGYVASVLEGVPGIAHALRTNDPTARQIETFLRNAPSQIGVPARWFVQVSALAEGRSRLRELVEALDAPAAPPRSRPESGRSEAISAAAGVALLLVPLRECGLADRLGAAGRHQLFLSALDGPARVLAGNDLALRWLAGLPDPPAATPAVDWPGFHELGLTPLHDGLADDAMANPSPEAPALRAVVDRFVLGLRGMQGSSISYLSRQFFARSGTLIRTEQELSVTLAPVPLQILLRVGGRLGDQGTFDWLGGRRLSIQNGNG